MNNETGKKIEFIFPIAIFFVFTISALIVILFAARVYQHTVADAATNYNANTSLAYIREKIHQYDNGYVSKGTFDNCDALILKEKASQDLYATYIYSYKGSLKELFITDGTEDQFSAESGQKILDVKEFIVEEPKSGVFSFECTDTDGNTATAIVGTYSKRKQKQQ